MLEFSGLKGQVQQSLLLTLLFALILPLAKTSATTTDVIVKSSNSTTDVRYRYAVELLDKVLAATEQDFGPYQLIKHTKQLSRTRTLVELKTGKNIHVMGEASKPEWENTLIPVRIPLRFGVQGFRLFLARQESQSSLSQVSTLEQLYKFKQGSGQQWSTRAILEEGGFNVVTSQNYDSLFKMLSRKRFDLFGRGINEVFAEHSTFSPQYPELVVETALGLYNYLPTYFYVSPAHPELAERIYEGMLRVIDNGKLQQQFCQYFGEDIKKAQLTKRTIFCLRNVNLSPDIYITNENILSVPLCEKGILDTQNLAIESLCNR